MAERPILFSTPMVRAILCGDKTTTRRIIKPQPDPQLRHHRRLINLHGREGRLFSQHEDMREGQQHESRWCPYGKPGDHLWVRETHYVERAGTLGENDQQVLYRATDGDAPVSNWRPSIHMPRWASRILLEVTDVRVERLLNMDRGACMEEGCPFPNMHRGPNPIHWFKNLWDSINGPGSWEADPWVWVIRFKRIPNRP